VDGRDVRGLGPRAVGFLLRGPGGSSTPLEVESSDGKRRKLTLQRVVRRPRALANGAPAQ
jgi:C-terminal processing protease CtpA/Prc